MQEELITAGCTLITLALTYFITVGTTFLKAKIKDFKGSEVVRDKELLKIGLETAEKAVETMSKAAVGKLEQIIGKDLREAVKNEQTSKEELYALADDAYKEIMESLSPELIEILQSSVKNVELYVRNEIEWQVLQVKTAMK